MSTQDITEIAKVEVRKALGPFFLGFVYDDGKTDKQHLEEATSAVMGGISRLLQQREAPRNKLGATVMTHTASLRTGKDGLPGIPPRQL